MVLNDTIQICDGVKAPRLGLGTWFIEGEAATQAVCDAAAIGYRHFDTAEGYGNEREVGAGVRACGLPRNQVFLTTKLEAAYKTYDQAHAGIEKSLADLDCGYIDLMIIHSPQPWSKVNQSDDRYFAGNLEAWRALEDAQSEGKIRAIGVSNFQPADLQNILDHGRVKPAVNQVLCHVGNTPWETIDFCRQQGIAIEAYSPVAHGAILGNTEVAAMADRYGVSVPQLCIRYCLQLGAIALPKTANPDHMRTNAQVDFQISDADMETLRKFKPVTDYGEANQFPVYGGKL